MELTRILVVFSCLSSLYLLVVIPIVTSKEAERIKVGPDVDKEPKKINPYITKFHETANLRPTKCQGKC